MTGRNRRLRCGLPLPLRLHSLEGNDVSSLLSPSYLFFNNSFQFTTRVSGDVSVSP